MIDCKNRIVEEAALLFRTYGIRAVTMDMIATNLGISKRTIYENFRDKDELLLNVLKCMQENQIALIESKLNSSENVIEALFSLLTVSSDHFRSMSPAFFVDIKKYHHTLLSSGVCGLPDLSGSGKIVERGVADGVFRDDIDKEIVNRGLYGIFRLTGDFELYPSGEFQRHHIVKHLYINFLRGISTPKGLKLIDDLEPGMEMGT
jgi:TetR/AcrR family transcriptional regulator, cholesterol catabolism regulator